MRYPPAAVFLSEVLPPFSAEWPAIPICIEQDNFLLSRDPADSCDGDAGKPRRHVSSRASREQQLVVFAAVHGIFQRDERTLTADPSARDGRSRNFAADSGFFADVGEIAREAVAEVYHRRGDPLLPQKAADCNPWNRREVAREIARLGPSSGEKFVQGCGRASEIPGHVDFVAGPRTRTQHSASARNISGDNDVRVNAVWGLGGIASGDVCFEFVGGRQKSFKKSIDPSLGQFSRKGQREKGGGRLASHGGDIAQPTGQTTAPHNLRGMPFAPKMDTFDTEIRRDEYIKVLTNPLNGAIISNTGNQ